MMKSRTILHSPGIALVLLCLWVCHTNSAEDLESQLQTDRADIYLMLRNVAFPHSPYSTSETTHNRFILMYPGKVLNYYDYYPGDEYTASLKTANYETARYNLVPPSIMEKWFDITDVVPSGFLDGGMTSGKKLSTIYETIISQMTVKNFNELYTDAKVKYNEARKYLTEPVQNPVNRSDNTTRMFLYSFYQEEYAQRQLEMEETINAARKVYSSLEYQLWFQRNYDLLNTKVENSYTKWLVLGNKQLVESYKTYLETTSTNTQLENARVLLRSSGVTSLDRTRTVYPVSFEPSNWYEYLLSEKVPPTRDMLITKRSLFQSQKDVLITILKYNASVKSKDSNSTNALVNSSTEKRNNATIEALRLQNNCLYKRIKDENDADAKIQCKEFVKAVDNVVTTTFQQAQTKSDFITLSYLQKFGRDYRFYLQSRIQSLDREIEGINVKLNSSHSVYLGDIADAPELNVVKADASGERGNKWMQFKYYRNSSKKSTNRNSRTVSVGLGILTPLNNGGKVEFGLNQVFVRDLLNCRDTKITGELLRVTIKRPWFRPSLFENPSLNFVQIDDDTGESTYVSPPPSSEEDLRKYINGVGNHHYLLPEYVTSFLLARRLKIEFSGLEAHTTSTASYVFAQASISVSSVNFLKPIMGQQIHENNIASEILKALEVFGFELSLGVNVREEHVTTTRTATGLILSIPGVQLIGYYTQVMPEFPRGQT